MDDVKCIVAIVQRGKADKVVDAAKEVGATGATILYGRGTGESEALKFFNLNIDASKEIILILSESKKLKPIYEAMTKEGNLNAPGTGVLFTIPIDHLIGLHHRQAIEDLKIDLNEEVKTEDN